MPFHWHRVCHCFHTTSAELSSWERPYAPQRGKSLLSGPHWKILPTFVLDHRRGVVCLTHSQDGGTLLCANMASIARRTSMPLGLLLSPASPNILAAKGDQPGMPSPDIGRFLSVPENTSTCAQDPELVLPLPTPGPWAGGQMYISNNIASQT